MEPRDRFSVWSAAACWQRRVHLPAITHRPLYRGLTYNNKQQQKGLEKSCLTRFWPRLSELCLQCWRWRSTSAQGRNAVTTFLPLFSQKMSYPLYTQVSQRKTQSLIHSTRTNRPSRQKQTGKWRHNDMLLHHGHFLLALPFFAALVVCVVVDAGL